MRVYTIMEIKSDKWSQISKTTKKLEKQRKTKIIKDQETMRTKETKMESNAATGFSVHLCQLK